MAAMEFATAGLLANRTRVSSHSSAPDAEGVFEFRGVASRHFEEVDALVLTQIMKEAYFAVDDIKLIFSFGPGAARHEANHLVFIFSEQLLRDLVQFHFGNAQFGGSHCAGNERGGYHRRNKEGSDFDALRALKDIQRGCIDEDQRDEQKWPAEGTTPTEMVTAQAADVMRTKTPVA